MVAYYNEIDPKAAAWLRELIKQGHIADGVVDERSIIDVKPEELERYTQCHFFAGIGVWSYTLRQAGWPDDKPVWTGSCPCQPFSTAGKGKGKEDKRHLWPEMYRLISECKPNTVFGEQVGGKAGLAWLDDVQSSLEGIDYACGAITFPACSVGSPHQRQREYWVAESLDDTMLGRHELTEKEIRTGRQCIELSSESGGLSDTEQRGRKGGAVRQTESRAKLVTEDLLKGGLADLQSRGHERGESSDQASQKRTPQIAGQSKGLRKPEPCDDRHLHDDPAPTNGLWKDVDWLYCRDGKWRPVEPGTFPLANGAAERVGRLRGYGNAIVAPQAKIFIETFMELH